MWIFLILIISCSLLIIALCKRVNRPFHPGKVFSYFWLGQICTIIIFHNYFNLYYYGLLYIMFCCLSFLLGSVCFEKVVIKNKKTNVIPIEYININFVRIIMVLLLLVGMVNPIIKLIDNGINLFSLLNFEQLLDINNEMSVARYSNEEKNSIYSQLLLVFTYLLPLYSGYALNFFYRRKDFFLPFLSIVPSLFIALTQGVKMAFMTSVILFIIGVIVSNLIYGIKLRITLKLCIKLFTGLFCFFVVIFLSIMFRIGSFDLETFIIVQHKLISYAVGHLPAFDYWYTSHLDIKNVQYTFGAKLFYGISNILGILERNQGIYSDLVVIANDGSVTNVYTIFRMLVEDFGSFIGLLYMFLVGAINQIFYRSIKETIAPFLSATFLSISFFVIFWSYVTSVLAYTTYCVMFILFYFLIKITNNLSIRNL